MPQSTQVPLPHPNGPLTGYRVVDFSDEKGQLCARLLGEFGADVIKVEPRDGDAGRRLGPFFRGEEGPETSLWWWAMNAGKRSVTCELRLEAGRGLAGRLADEADIVVETFPPGRAKEYGLEYSALAARNPKIVVVSITAFGLTGPYRSWAATDIVGSAMGGHMHLNGDEEHGPVRTLAPQAYAQVNVQAAVGALIAIYGRVVTGGMGQHVDVSMQEAMTNAMDNAQPTWDIRGVNARGPGVRRNVGGIVGARYVYEAADGWISCLQVGGLIGPTANAIIDWMDQTNEAGDLTSPAWRERLSTLQPLEPEERAHVEELLAAFCRSRGKEDLVREAQSRGSGWAPVFSPRDIVDSRQLFAREYWARVQHGDLGESFVFPGPPARLSLTPWAQRGRAPHVGEHNSEVYGGLGLTDADLRRLKLRMVI